MSYDTLAEIKTVMTYNKVNRIKWTEFIDPENASNVPHTKGKKRNIEEVGQTNEQNVIPVGMTRSSQAAAKKRREGDVGPKQGNKSKKKKRGKNKRQNVPPFL